MHPAAYEYVKQEVGKYGPFPKVVEIGSRNINGSVRPLFPKTQSYVGLDLYEGPDVDWVGDSTDYKPDVPVDAVICCEVLEHAENWKEIVKVGATWLRPKGRMITTCAAENRPAHSAIDGAWTLREGEYYHGLSVQELADVLDAADIVAWTRQVGRDLQSSGWKWQQD